MNVVKIAFNSSVLDAEYIESEFDWDYHVSKMIHYLRISIMMDVKQVFNENLENSWTRYLRI